MKTFNFFSISLIFFSFVLVPMSSFKIPQAGEQLTITNKTGSDIDEIHVGDSGDILDEDEILEPGESVTLDFDCEGLHADVEATIHLIFEDESQFSFDDTVCDGDFEWEIVDDGKE